MSKRKQIYKSIDLITANVMHRAASNIESVISFANLNPMIRKLTETEILQIELARGLLITIAAEADPKHVFAALKAIGAPSTPADMMEGLQAVKDAAS